MYKIINDTQILRTTDNAIIPVCEENNDYQEYLKWTNEGNQAEKLKTETSMQTIFSKLAIVEAFEKLGQIEILSQLLNNQKFYIYWISANEIDLNHKVTKEAIERLNDDDSNNLTTEQIIEVIREEIL